MVKVAKTAAGSVERVGGGSGLAGLKLPSTPALRKRQGGIQRSRARRGCTELGRRPKRAGSAQWAGEAIARAREAGCGERRAPPTSISAPLPCRELEEEEGSRPQSSGRGRGPWPRRHVSVCTRPRPRLAHLRLVARLATLLPPAIAPKLGAAQVHMQAWWQGMARVTAGSRKPASDYRDDGAAGRPLSCARGTAGRLVFTKAAGPPSASATARCDLARPLQHEPLRSNEI